MISLGHGMAFLTLLQRIVLFRHFRLFPIGIQEHKCVSLDDKVWRFMLYRLMMMNLLDVCCLDLFVLEDLVGKVVLGGFEYLLDLQMDSCTFGVVIVE